MENIEIKLVEENEFAEVENVVRNSFWNVFRPGCVEHFLVHRARENNWLVRALDYCITKNNKIIGHIMFSHANILLDSGFDKDILVLGPVCIIPEEQRKGYGQKLVQTTLSLAMKYGYGAVAVVGNPKFFEKVGFEPAENFNLHYAKLERDKPAPFFLVKELQNGFFDDTSSTFEPNEVFAVTMDEVEEYDKNFEPKEKSKKTNKIVVKI